MQTREELITNADLAALNAHDRQTLAEWWCTLNRWEWPHGLPDPEDGDARRRGELNGSRAWPIMCWISKRIGNRIISRAWNKDMPSDVFDDFYDGTYNGDAEARARYEAWRDSRDTTENATH